MSTLSLLAPVPPSQAAADNYDSDADDHYTPPAPKSAHPSSSRPRSGSQSSSSSSVRGDSADNCNVHSDSARPSKRQRTIGTRSGPGLEEGESSTRPQPTLSETARPEERLTFAQLQALDQSHTRELHAGTSGKGKQREVESDGQEPMRIRVKRRFAGEDVWSVSALHPLTLSSPRADDWVSSCLQGGEDGPSLEQGSADLGFFDRRLAPSPSPSSYSYGTQPGQPGRPSNFVRPFTSNRPLRARRQSPPSPLSKYNGQPLSLTHLPFPDNDDSVNPDRARSATKKSTEEAQRRWFGCRCFEDEEQGKEDVHSRKGPSVYFPQPAKPLSCSGVKTPRLTRQNPSPIRNEQSSMDWRAHRSDELTEEERYQLARNRQEGGGGFLEKQEFLTRVAHYRGR